MGWHYSCVECNIATNMWIWFKVTAPFVRSKSHRLSSSASSGLYFLLASLKIDALLRLRNIEGDSARLPGETEVHDYDVAVRWIAHHFEYFYDHRLVWTSQAQELAASGGDSCQLADCPGRICVS